MTVPARDRRRPSLLAKAAWVASIASASLLPIAAAAALFAGQEFWSAFKSMQDDVVSIKIGMSQAVERGVATRLELGRLGQRVDRQEARIDRIQEARQ